MSDFWTPEPILFHEGGAGFRHFCPDHLMLLTLSFVLVPAIVACYRRLPARDGEEPPSAGPSPARRRLLILASGGAVAILVARAASYLALSLMEPLFWPLHICNLCELAALAYALWPTSRVGQRMGDLLFCWGTTGCAAALLFPGWSPYCPAWSLASLCGFVEHALVLACALCLVVGGDYTPRPRRIWFVLGMSIACGLLFRLVNPLLGTNFFFVTNPSATSPLGAWIARACGDPGFLLAYLCLACVLWVATYGLWAVCQRGRRRAQ